MKIAATGAFGVFGRLRSLAIGHAVFDYDSPPAAFEWVDAALHLAEAESDSALSTKDMWVINVPAGNAIKPAPPLRESLKNLAL